MRRYVISIRWRSFRWRLQGIARCSADLVLAMIDHAPPGAFVTVKPHDDSVNAYAEAMIRKDQLERLEGKP